MSAKPTPGPWHVKERRPAGTAEKIATGDSGHAAATGYSGHAAALSYNGKAKAGTNGAVVLAWWDGKRGRFLVGYVGEDGIEADTWYGVVDGNLAKVVA